jgi:hypothetical protein
LPPTLRPGEVDLQQAALGLWRVEEIQNKIDAFEQQHYPQTQIKS